MKSSRSLTVSLFFAALSVAATTRPALAAPDWSWKEKLAPFGLEVKGKWGPKKVTGTIGGGGRTLNVKSVNGSIELRKRA